MDEKDIKIWELENKIAEQNVFHNEKVSKLYETIILIAFVFVITTVILISKNVKHRNEIDEIKSSVNQDSFNNGYEEGYNEGFDCGYDEGFADGENSLSNYDYEEDSHHAWIDVDGDGIEEYEEVYSIDDLDEDTIFSNGDLICEYFDSGRVNVRDIDVDTILCYPYLKEYIIDNFESADVMEMIATPNSSCFSSISYSPIWEILILEFRETGAMYYYYDVPRDVGESFVESDTLGEDYNRYIKGRYECECFD